MHKIVKKQNLAKNIDRFSVKAPLIAKKARAGQFVVIRVHEDGERIPLTLADFDREQGTISLVSMRVGKTTALLSELKEGDNILDLAGPLGNPSKIENFGRVICVGGGVGVAPVLPIAKELKKAGNYVISIIGAKNKGMLILAGEMDAASNELHICTDDGSAGFSGFVSEFLVNYLKENTPNISRVIAIGPALMMAAVAGVTKPFHLKTIVSLNSIMVDGTGMCGACRIEVDGKTRFVCVDGPEFDGHRVNFDLLLARQDIYCDHEGVCMDLYLEECETAK